MKKTRNNWLRLICFALAALIPAVLALTALLAVPPVYGETFLGELADKYARLRDCEEPKIVIIGGSSVAFGIDSAAIGEKTGYKVVNFGLYATLGTKIMLDLSERSIRKGDIVILAPELDKQTLSLYFNATSAWQGLEGDLSMLFRVGSDNWGDLLAGLPNYLYEKISHWGKEPLSPDGVYRHDSFNEYGDISYPRPYNVMTFQFDKNNSIRLIPEIFDGDFVDYLNDYIDRVKRKGAQVGFTYCPMDAAALAANTTDESIQAFHDYVCSILHCQVISDPANSIMDKGYFFDTNYHLNDAGVKVHTAYLTADILAAFLGRTDGVTEELPPPPGKRPAAAPTGEAGTQKEQDPWEKYFVYSDFGGQLMITGTTDEARYATELELPATADGKPVAVLGKGALSGCRALRELTVRETLTPIEDGALACPTLLSVSLRRENADTLEVGKNLFDGAPDELKLLLYTQTSYDNFSSGYWWSVHAERMRME